MNTNIVIERFAQQLYVDYNIGMISYGFNPVSDTYIVMIDKAELFANEQFLEKVYDFTHAQAEVGEWIMFVSPSDPVCFDDYQPIVREYANTKAVIDVNSWFSKLFDSENEWSKVSFNQTSHISSVEDFPKEKFEYALAA